MAALSSYHNIWMMNQAASKSVVMLLTQGFLPSPCPVGPEGGTEEREKGFVQPRCLFVMGSAVYLVCYSLCFDLISPHLVCPPSWFFRSFNQTHKLERGHPQAVHVEFDIQL